MQRTTPDVLLGSPECLVIIPTLQSTFAEDAQVRTDLRQLFFTESVDLFVCIRRFIVIRL